MASMGHAWGMHGAASGPLCTSPTRTAVFAPNPLSSGSTWMMCGPFPHGSPPYVELPYGARMFYTCMGGPARTHMPAHMHARYVTPKPMRFSHPAP